MKLAFFRLLAKINKTILPSFSKKQLDLSKASKLELAIIGWRYWVTTKALN
ncbi:SsrA-binding protein [Maribacter sp.]|uniref:SsrA-binding protein n=1 Tax=Maribacter sp. TaxID=1897614 RepID=UPI0025BD3D38|nr:SsrA-binding protein [Maribacter sp.]